MYPPLRALSVWELQHNLLLVTAQGTLKTMSWLLPSPWKHGFCKAHSLTAWTQLPLIRQPLQSVERAWACPVFVFIPVTRQQVPGVSCYGSAGSRKPSSWKPGALKPQNLSFSLEAPATPQLPVDSLWKKALKLQAWIFTEIVFHNEIMAISLTLTQMLLN